MKLHAQIRRFREPASRWSVHLNEVQMNRQALEDDATDESVSLTQADRSRDNIETWSSYLPDDCVSTMVAMGWDRTT